MKNWFTIMFLHTYGSLTLNQLHHNLHIHDFRLNHRIRVLRVHQKIDSLRVKINTIKDHHHDPYEKTSELDPSLDQFGSVFRKFKFKLGLCSWRVFWFISFEIQLNN